MKIMYIFISPPAHGGDRKNRTNELMYVQRSLNAVLFCRCACLSCLFRSTVYNVKRCPKVANEFFRFYKETQKLTNVKISRDLSQSARIGIMPAGKLFGCVACTTALKLTDQKCRRGKWMQSIQCNKEARQGTLSE